MIQYLLSAIRGEMSIRDTIHRRAGWWGRCAIDARVGRWRVSVVNTCTWEGRKEMEEGRERESSVNHIRMLQDLGEGQSTQHKGFVYPGLLQTERTILRRRVEDVSLWNPSVLAGRRNIHLGGGWVDSLVVV